MGSGKKRLQSKVEGRATEGTALSDQRAQELKDRLAETRSAAQGMSISGGYDPEQLDRLRTKLNEPIGGSMDPEQVAKLRATYGSAIGGYQNFADTGGFSEEEKTNFLRRASAPVAAMYARQKDEMGRRLALQGGYSPGFSTSAARLTRQGAQAGAEAALGANVDLATQLRTGKLAGLGGLTTTAQAQGGLERDVSGAELQREQIKTNNAIAQIGLERDLSTGRLRGLELMNDTERISIANTLAQMGVRQDEINSLLGVSGQKKDIWDKIGVVGEAAKNVGGAIAGATGGK